ncbi:unnamed protein product [Discosporangium mesarthrocarpum]
MAIPQVYGGGNPFFPGEGVKALNNITAQVSGPGAAALVGEACAGKTTLLKCIAGCEDPTAGTIKVSGMRKAVYVGGDLRSTSMRTVKDLLRKAVQEYHWDKKPSAMDETTDNILEAVDLNKQCNTRARDLSGGEVHRFALGMALAKGSAAPTPPVLLLDGIFYHLDSRIRVGVGRCIRDLEKRLGVMVIFTTFQEDCVREMATQVVDMQHGQIRQIAPLSESRYKTAADIHRMMNIEQERRQRQRDDELKAMGDLRQLACEPCPRVTQSRRLCSPASTASQVGGQVAPETHRILFITLVINEGWVGGPSLMTEHANPRQGSPRFVFNSPPVNTDEKNPTERKVPCLCNLAFHWACYCMYFILFAHFTADRFLMLAHQLDHHEAIMLP